MRRCLYAGALIVSGSVAMSCNRADDGARKASGAKSPVSRSVDVGLPAPAFATRSITGDSVSLARLRGRPLLLNVWATWCIPCRAEIPVVERLHQRYAPQGLTVVGINVDAASNLQAVRQFMTEYGITYSVWLDPEKQTLHDFVAIGVPATFLIGRDGTLLYKHMGPLQDTDWRMHQMIQHSLTD